MSDSDEDGGRWGYRGRSRSRSSSRSSREKDSYWYNRDSREGSDSPDSRRHEPYSNYFDGNEEDEEEEERKDRDGYGFSYDDDDKDSERGGLPHYYSRRSSNSSRNSHGSRRDIYLENEKDEENYEWNSSSWRCKRDKDKDSNSSRSSRSDRFGFRRRGDDSDDDGRSRRKRRRAAEAEDYLENEYGRTNHDRLPICCCTLM
ncbi:serine-aspartate repeat-containing protein C-like [Scylla paramamosain]|uniref:serine-aspartate repeat-containing protein C-like n=1 Tax=Scylla paramamosain TaxID=85552 RepID=UPI003083A1A5